MTMGRDPGSRVKRHLPHLVIMDRKESHLDPFVQFFDLFIFKGSKK
jgi:hypothetical protein